MIEFEVFLKPPSLNHYYGSKGNRRFITKEGKNFKNLFQASFPKTEKIYGRVSVHINFKFKDFRKRDIDNCIKLILDCMKDILFEDDDMIFELTANKTIGCGIDSIRVKISSLESENKIQDKKIVKINIIPRDKDKNV